MALSTLKQKAGSAFVGAAAVFSPLTHAGAEESYRVDPLQYESEDDVPISELQVFNEEEAGMNSEAFMCEQSKSGPVLLIVASSRNAALEGAHYAERIQRNVKFVKGYDIRVWLEKVPPLDNGGNVASITPYYGGYGFANGQKFATRSPQQAYEERGDFAIYCEQADAGLIPLLSEDLD